MAVDLIKQKRKQKVRSRKYYELNTERMKWNTRFHSYGISKEEFFLLLEKQNNKCAICEEPFKSIWVRDCHVDHDHEIDEVRGLLCMTCNVGLGMLGDNVIGLQKALDYVKGVSSIA